MVIFNNLVVIEFSFRIKSSDQGDFLLHENVLINFLN